MAGSFAHPITVTRRCHSHDQRPSARPTCSGDPLLLLKAAGSRGKDHQDLRCPRSGRANHRDPVTPPHLLGGKPGSGPPPGRDFGTGSTWASPPGSAAQPTPAEGRSSVSTEQRENL